MAGKETERPWPIRLKTSGSKTKRPYQAKDVKVELEYKCCPKYTTFADLEGLFA